MSLVYDCLTAILFHLLPLEGCPPHASSEGNVSMETITNGGTQRRGGKGGRPVEWLFILWDNDTRVHWKCATIKSIKEEY